MSATLHARMAEAWIHRRHRVCGRALDDYCAHHIQLLTVLESPLIEASGRIDWGRLMLACEVARTPYGGELRFPSAFFRVLWVQPRILATLLRWRLARLGRRAGRRRFPRALWPALASKLLLQRECRRFRAWQNDHQAEPDLFFDQEGTEQTAPALLSRVVFVMRHLHIPEERAWTMSIGKLLWHYATCLEQVGSGVRLLEPVEAGDMDLIRRIQQGDAAIPPEWAAQIEEALRVANPPAAHDHREVNLSVFGPPA